MANYAQTHKPTRLNLDKARKHLQPNETFYALNHEVNNPNAEGVATPLNGNYAACEMELPAGENYVLDGGYYSQITNETYSWHYNSNGVHHIQRINSIGECEIVYTGDCLILSADPKHAITKFRVLMDVDYYCNKVPNGKLKRLVWVDGTDTPMGCLDVEASIATNFFTTPFFDICGDPCAYLQMCVPEPQGCLIGEFVPFSDSDVGLSNRILDKGFKFAYRHVYYDQRASGLSDYSSLYYLDSKSCFDNTEGFSRCIKFRLPIGNPMVEKIEFYYSDNGGVSWYLYDTIEKYQQYSTTNQYWYQRSLSENITGTFSEEDCSFDYIFCNDKQRTSIDPKLLTRVLNPIPREAQGLFRVDQSIAAYNYVSGNCPIDKLQADKFDIQMDCTASNPCTPETAKVTVRAIIYTDVLNGESIGGNGYIYRSGGAPSQPDDPTDPAWFGSGFFYYDQTFRGERRNFIAYIEGTDYWGEMEQWKSGANFTSTQKIGVLSGLSDDSSKNWVKNDILSGNFYYQEYIFTVPKGMKGFVRLASHTQTSGAGSVNQKTSAQVAWMLGTNGLKSYNGITQITALGEGETIKEMYFDTCNGDFDSFDAFVVNDLTVGNGDNTGGFSGYIYDKDGEPVEGAEIYSGSTYRRMTDFNGFFFFHNVGNSVTANISVEQDCVGGFTNIASFGIINDNATHQMSRVNYNIQSDTYNTDFFAKVDVAVKDCNNEPVRGVRVAMSGSKYASTDTNGVAHFKLRNYNTRARKIVSVVMDRGNCLTLDCSNDCNPCMPSSTEMTLMACFFQTPQYTITQTTRINIGESIIRNRGLKMGGTYGFGSIIEGDCGKLSAVNPVFNNGGYFNMPRLQETGALNYCSFSYNANNALYPAWGKRLKIVRTANLNPFTLQWVVDDFERTSNGKLKLTIQSLNDYNAQYLFKTNTVYQFTAGDRVEFIKNGDGKIFDAATNGILNYQIISPFNNIELSGVTDNVNYFNEILINEDSKLDGLVKGAIIQINPLQLSVSQQTYYAICATIPLKQIEVNGVMYSTPIAQTGTFTTFDTYLVNRQIGHFPAQLFEHKSPSDFWGETVVDGLSDFISDIGKAYFLNPYENEKRYERNISVGAENQLNYFGDFVKTLDAVEQGGIVAISVKDNAIGLAICENDNLLFQVSDDFLRLGNDGIVRAAPVDSIISNPEAKLRGEYGCDYSDIGGILFGDGFAIFPCSKASSLVIHNYSVAQKCGLSVNQENGLTETSCQSFFQKRMRDKATHNSVVSNFLDHYRYSIGQNSTNSVIYLTLKTLRHPATNNESEVYAAPNDTIIYTPLSDAFLGFAGFTPEGYSQIDLDSDGGCAFITYQNSVPYIHPINTDKWNLFYGIPVDWMVGIVINKFPDKQKIAISLEEQSDKMFYVKRVTTDKPTFFSEVPPIKVKQNGNKWNFSFLNDVNSKGGLYNGDAPRGYQISVLLIRDNSVNSIYNSTDNTKREQFSVLDNFISKMSVVEQSGFTNNL